MLIIARVYGNLFAVLFLIGALSHGAVADREAGLPAGISIRDVVYKLKNGQKARVDGKKIKLSI
ncbi:MAG: hypothetical protein LBG46_00800 [Elusimicrobiota bacterium]|nr:hypothetical protein [Elusimicrobiota bacterium]